MMYKNSYLFYLKIENFSIILNQLHKNISRFILKVKNFPFFFGFFRVLAKFKLFMQFFTDTLESLSPYLIILIFYYYYFF